MPRFQQNPAVQPPFTVAGHGASHLFMKNLGVKQESQLFSEELLENLGGKLRCKNLSKCCNFRMNCITWTHKMDVLHIAGANHAPFFQGTMFNFQSDLSGFLSTVN